MATTLQSQAGQTYYVNQLPTALAHRVKNNPGLLHTQSVNLLFVKNIYQPVQVMGELESWLTQLKQPTEKQVREAMLLSIDEDYTLKSGGGSKSDYCYSSSLKWLQAHPVSGEDTEPVLIKKFSNRFEDVLISAQDIRSLFAQVLTSTQQQQRLTETIDSVLGLLHRGLLTGGIDIIQSGARKTVPFTEAYQQKLLDKIDTPLKHQIARCRLEVHMANTRKHKDHIEQPGHGILGKDLTSVCPQATQTYTLQLLRILDAWKQVEALLMVSRLQPQYYEA